MIGVLLTIVIGTASAYAFGSNKDKEVMETHTENPSTLLIAMEYGKKSPYQLRLKEYDEHAFFSYNNEAGEINVTSEEQEEVPNEDIVPPKIINEPTKELVQTEEQREEKVELLAAKQPAPRKQPEVVITHEVKTNETLFSITMTYFTSSIYQDKIADFNQIENPTDIKAGAVIKIPDPEIITKHQVAQGETLYSITRKYYNTTEHLISLARYNNIGDPKTDVKAGMYVTIPHPKTMRDFERNNYAIHINKSNNTLTVYKNSQMIRQFSVATGRNASQTPEGLFKIANKVEAPWYNPKNIPGGVPENPLGSHWLGLNVPGTNNFIYGIHGTNDPSSLGNYVSLGCIRMHNEDVLWMYNTIPLNTSVYIF